MVSEQAVNRLTAAVSMLVIVQVFQFAMILGAVAGAIDFSRVLIAGALLGLVLFVALNVIFAMLSPKHEVPSRSR